MMGRRPFLKGALMSMWRPRGDAPKPGTGAQPQRADQQYDPPGPLVAPGGRAGIFRGRLVVITGGGPPGSGIFVYNPSPGASNLIASIAATGGHDPYGNLVLQGIADYTGGASPIAIQINNSFIRFSQATTEVGPYTPFATLGPFGADFEILVTGNLQLTAGITSAIVANSNVQLAPGVTLEFQGASSGTSTITPLVSANGVNYNGQLNMTALPINIEAMAAPGAPGSGTKLFAPNSGGLRGHLLTIGTDGNTYATETLTFITQGQAISSTSPAALTGISVPLILGTTYKIKAMIPYSSTSVAGTAVFNFVLSGTATIASGFASAIFGVPGAAVTMNFRNTTATGSITSPVLASGQSVMWLEAIMDIGTADGTLTFTAQEGTNLDTFSILAGGYFSISPVA